MNLMPRRVAPTTPSGNVSRAVTVRALSPASGVTNGTPSRQERKDVQLKRGEQAAAADRLVAIAPPRSMPAIEMAASGAASKGADEERSAGRAESEERDDAQRHDAPARTNSAAERA